MRRSERLAEKVLMQEGGGVAFSETQRFTQRWIAVLVSLMALGIWAMALSRFVFHRPQGAGTVDDALLAFTWVLVGMGVPLLFLTMELVVEVRRDGLYVRFAPFHRRPRVFLWQDIAEFRARRYRPIREFGGWGIRWGRSGRAYNVRGDRGLQLVLRDGRRLLIGSQRAEELEEAMRLARDAAVQRGSD